MADEKQLPEPLQDLTLLEDICQPYFGMVYAVARRRHAQGTLPIRAFRLNDSRRGPLYVHNDDLAALVRKRRTKTSAPTVAGASLDLTGLAREPA